MSSSAQADRQEPKAEGIPADVRKRLRAARLTLAWERLWRLAWPLPALAAGLAAVALFDVLPTLPAWAHLGVLLAFAAAAAAALWRLRRLSWPSERDASRRLEQDSGLPHRPLRSLSDRLIAGAGDPFSQALWQAERSRRLASLRRLSLKRPAPDLARHDPYGLRFAPLLLLAIALAGGWRDAGPRLLRALEPPALHLGGPLPVLQVWLTPPAYTGRPPILVDAAKKGRHLALPVDTGLLAVLQGGHGEARLFIDGKAQLFQSLDAGSQRIETTMTRAGRLVIRQGRRRIADWRITLERPTPPVIAFAGLPQTDREGRLRLDVEGHDSYGIAKAWASIRRTDTPGAEPLIVPLPLGGGHPGSLREASWHDLTGHPWAGLPVTIEPDAENVAGLHAAGEPLGFTLPERVFTNPVARAIVAARHRLAAEPDRRPDVVPKLAAIAANPQSFGGDLTVYLALSTAASRLMRDRSADAVPSVIDILWQAALRVEDGDKPAARNALDDIARQLENALANNAPQAEIERLTAELRTAMERYLDALAEQAKRQGLPVLPEDPDHPGLSPEDLQSMLERLRALSQTGSTDAARQTLNDLRQMLDGLDAALSGSTGRQFRQAEQTMHALQSITEQQRQLLDETFRRAGPSAERTGRPGIGASRAENRAAAERQEALRKRLGQALQSLSDMEIDIPEPLGQAEQSMREAAQALRQDRLEDALDAQTDALTHLQEGGQAAGQSLARQMGPGMVRRGAGHDPLGRPLQGGPGAGDDRSVKIPNQTELQKAREVLEELRRRASQPQRPSDERDYLHRLLQQFF